jgi:ribosome-binding factor A
MARVIRDSVSTTIRNKLSDPRITGLVSVTEVDISPDAKNATVYLSVFGADEDACRLTFTALCHAVGPIQAFLGKDLPGRVCPRLRLELDTKMKRTLETLQLIEEAGHENRDSDAEEMDAEAVGDVDPDEDDSDEDAR